MQQRWRVRRSTWPPEPPFDMPPARTVIAPGRGELFLRDSGGDGPVVMLLHGWMATADLNWCGAYGALIDAGYRVMAIDHRGHGRGLRPLVPFSLTECAADAAAALRALGPAPAHMDLVERGAEYNPVLLEALAVLRSRSEATEAQTGSLAR